MRNAWVVIVAGLCFILSGCATARPAKFEVYGSMARMTGDPGALGDTMDRVLLPKFAHVIHGEGGAWSCPSYRVAASHWSRSRSAAPTPYEVFRSEISFDDPSGTRIKIETIRATGDPTIILVTYDKPDGPEQILHELREGIKAQGIKLE